jgi:superoxide reductase
MIMSEMNRRNFVKAVVVSGALLETAQITRPAFAQEAGEQQPKTAEDPNNMTPLESHHVPKIEPAKANPKAGEELPVAITIEHPMTPEHHIIHVVVFVDGKKITTCTLAPEVMKPALTVVLTPKQSFEIAVQDLCNIHGLWENRRRIEVV